MTAKLKDNGTRYDHCIGKGWTALNHVELECYTKRREQSNKANTEKVKGKQGSDDDGVSICHIMVKIAGDHI